MLEQTVPETGIFELKVPREIDIRCSANEARRKVGYWVTEYVHFALMAKKPTLNITHSGAVWNVPIIFTSVMVGEVGTVGYGSVDVKTGEIIEITDGQEIMQCVVKLRKTLPPFKLLDVDPAFLDPNIPRARIIDVHNE